MHIELPIINDNEMLNFSVQWSDYAFPWNTFYDLYFNYHVLWKNVHFLSLQMLISSS